MSTFWTLRDPANASPLLKRTLRVLLCIANRAASAAVVSGDSDDADGRIARYTLPSEMWGHIFGFFKRYPSIFSFEDMGLREELSRVVGCSAKMDEPTAVMRRAILPCLMGMLKRLHYQIADLAEAL